LGFGEYTIAVVNNSREPDDPSDMFFQPKHQAERPEAQEGIVSPEPKTLNRILALDVGTKTIGQAVSDPLGITAQGLETIRRRNKRADFGSLERTIRRFHISELVVGYPLRLSGAPSAQTQAVQEFAEELRKKFSLPVHLWDERLTSAEANRVLRLAEASIQKRAQAVDRMAAVLILQSFLEARRGGYR
jgi:putative Holliday junction resolvase